MSAELYEAKFATASEKEKEKYGGAPVFEQPPQGEKNAMAAIRVLQDPHVAHGTRTLVGGEGRFVVMEVNLSCISACGGFRSPW